MNHFSPDEVKAIKFVHLQIQIRTTKQQAILLPPSIFLENSTTFTLKRRNRNKVTVTVDKKAEK
jgi:hypothetical protein